MNLCIEQCADEVLDVIPLIMRWIRAKMRSHRAYELSVPQFRAMVFAERNRGATLADLSGHLGLMPPAASNIVNGLVTMDLIERRPISSDRRRVRLALTSAGRKKLKSTRKMAQEYLVEKLVPLPPAECEQISTVMQKLRVLFE
jgi:DNA-binding MarR family transcriptional regulator